MSNYRILFVDDDPDFRQEISPLLEQEGYTVVQADSGKQAEEFFAKEKFDLAILDLRMEHPDTGFTVAFHFKKAKAEMPIIMVSSVNREMGYNFTLNTPQERAWIKADAFLNKPIRFEQLKYEIEKLLG